MSVVTRLTAIALLLATPALAHAERTFGLVIGINNYHFVQTLDGARPDAIDISQALRRNGATQVVTLLDDDATKANVTGAWQSLMNEAEPGDVIVLSYAGHGAQAPERNAGEERDHLDEFWVLTGFDPDHVRDTWHETIFDNEVYDWVTEASRRGIHVVVVADSCHAGGMDRAVNGKVRFLDFSKNRSMSDLMARMLGSDSGAGQVSNISESVLPANVTLLAATPESQSVPEVAIDGQVRGALSWSFARAVEGLADENGDGIVSRNEMEDYIMANVRMRSESLQTPVFTPLAARSADEAMIPLTSQANMQMASESAGQGAVQPAPMARDLGFKPVLPVVVEGSSVKLENTVNGNLPYIWDAKRGVFKTPNGDIAAENVSAYTVNDVVSKFILVDFLKAVASKRPGRTEISPQKRLYRAGDRIKFDALRGNYRNMLVFNLANTGEVQYLDMMVDGQPTSKEFLKEMQVVAPFGSDHLITIASNQPLEPIGRVVQRGVSPKELLQVLQSRIDGTDAAVSITPIYTRNN